MALKNATSPSPSLSPIETGTQKPDLVVWKEKDAWVVDVTIVADNANLNECCDRKARYYDSPEVTSWVKNFTSSETVVYEGLAINWRGAMAPKAFEFLRDVFRLSLNDLQLLSVKTVTGNFYSYVAFKKSMYQVGGS